MDAKQIEVAAVLLIAIAIATYRFYRTLSPVFRGQPINRFDQPLARLKGVLTNVGGHQRLLQVRLTGVAHLMIFYGFLVLLTAIVQAFGEGLSPGFRMAAIGGDTWIAALQDLFGVLVFCGLGLVSYNRFVKRPKRFQGSNSDDATRILIFIAVIVASMYLQNACRIALGGDPSAGWRPVESGIAQLISMARFRPDTLVLLAGVFYWIHILTILGFLIYIPSSKHLHMFVAVPNIFFRDLAPKGLLSPATAPQAEKGLTEIGNLTWKHTLDLFACTECGRCQDACPANAAGQPLSPKRVIMDLRDHLLSLERGTDTMPPNASGPIASGAILPETVWSCTTCRACMEVCPLHIEHVPKIVDLRRSLVEEGRIEPMLQENLGNLMEYGNSFGKPARHRFRWMKGLDFKPKDARKEPVDILWFVGDFASFDERVQKITRHVATLLNAAGVDFGLLYEDEQNSGNDVKRVGEFGLFKMLAEQNIETLNSCQFNRIMTTDPHTLNALRNEYPALGARYPVHHYTEILLELLREGRLPFVHHEDNTTATYHDPCYLGRYNGGFDAPREIIQYLGYRLHDMGRCRERSFCCGAGGGRIWMDDSGLEERPSENRIREALGLGDASLFVVSCPKDVVMYSAAVQNTGASERLAVRDISELIALEG